MLEENASKHLRYLVEEIGPRGSTTEGEFKAGEYIKQIFEKSGLKVEVQEFKSIPTFSYPYMVIYLVAIIGVFLSIINTWFLILTVALYLIYIEEYVYMRPIITKAVAKVLGRKSRNIIGIYRSGEPKVVFVLSAHYDTTKAASTFKPEKVKSLRSLLNASFYTFMLLATYSLIYLTLDKLDLLTRRKLYFIDLNLLLYIIALVISIPLIVTLLNLFERELKHTYVPGANDNGSGTVVLLSLAERIPKEKPENVEIYFVATGSEEVGMLGMINFEKQYKDILTNAYTVNLDNPGKGELVYTTCEGLIKIFCCKKGKLLEAAEKAGKRLGVPSFKYRLLPTDATILMRDKLEAISIMAFGEKGIPVDYHWYTDNIENINLENLKKAEEIAINIINLIREQRT